MLDHSNTDNTIYDIRDPLYWDKESLYQEMDRVYDICIGCRLCFNLCPSFPSLFDSVDNAGTRKREIAEQEGRVGKQEQKKIHTLIFLKGSTPLRQVSKLNSEVKLLISMKRNAGKLSTFATNASFVILFVHILLVRSMSFTGLS